MDKVNKVLSDKTIVLTRDKDQCFESGKWLHNLGARVICFPTIRIVPIDETSKLFSTMRSTSFDYLIFSSLNAVSIFKDLIQNTEHKNITDKAIIIAVGSKTKEICEQLGIKVDMIPENFSAKGILEMFEQYDLNNKNILIPSSIIARNELREGLTARNANVFPIPVYSTIMPEFSDIKNELLDVKESNVDLFIFTSPSTYNNYLKLADVEEPASYFEKSNIAAIGTITKSAIEDTGVKVDITPHQFTMNDLIDEIVKFYK